jgi:hypothetical protein
MWTNIILFEIKFGVKILKIDKLPISGFLPWGNEGVSSLWLSTECPSQVLFKVSTPKCDTCFSLGTWEGVVQIFY